MPHTLPSQPANNNTTNSTNTANTTASTREIDTHYHSAILPILAAYISKLYKTFTHNLADSYFVHCFELLLFNKISLLCVFFNVQ